MTSGRPPATALARNAVTLSFCQAARSALTAMAILVSKRMRDSLAPRRGPVLNGGAAVVVPVAVAPVSGPRENKGMAQDWSRYWRAPDMPLEAMYAHFDRHVYHRHSHESYSF